MAAFFVTGAGTDIGKTWASAQLLRHWRLKGLEPDAVKPVASGYDPARPEDSDAAALLRALGRPVTAETVEAMTPIRLRAPLSPDQAARREGAWISARSAAMACQGPMALAKGPVLVEGAGGAMTPLNDSETMLDLALALGLPSIFLTGSYLGAISHALTGLAAMRARGAAVALVLVNETPGSTVDLHETAETLRSHAHGTPVLAVPRDADDAVWTEAGRLLRVEALAT
ncbi:MAG TPA: dethiobiotin synthase [Caulobacteraceae bacterium]